MTYTSKDPNPALEAIAGTATYRADKMAQQWDQNKQYLNEHKGGILAAIIGALVAFKFLSLALISLLLWFIGKPWYARAAAIVKTQPWNALGIGFAVLIGMPILAVILLFTGLLSVIGGLVFALWIFMLLFMEVALVLVATAWLRMAYNKTGAIRKDVLWIIILSLICSLITGVDTLLAVFAIGALTIMKARLWERLKSDPTV